MRIIASFIDYNKAGLEIREKFALTQSEIIKLNINFKETIFVSGCVIISTCNRTEIYVSTIIDEIRLSPVELFLKFLDYDINKYKDNFVTVYDKFAIKRLMEISCGLKSQILFEDQILSQIGQAMFLAKECGSIDSFLSTLFRKAKECGKEVKTNIKICNVPLSAAHNAIHVIKQKFDGNIFGKNILVIGNGKMGRLCAKLLIKENCNVTITLRRHNDLDTIVPANCKTINYINRFNEIENMDIVISATTSPHFTMTKKDLLKNKIKNIFVLDLSVPRDIEPSINDINTIQVFNIDDISYSNEKNEIEIKKVNNLINNYVEEYYKWLNYKLSIDIINDIKDTVNFRIKQNENLPDNADDLINFTTEKTINMLLGSLKEVITPGNMERCLKKLKDRCR